MKTTRIRRSFMILMALAAAFSLLLAVPSSAATKKYKLMKTYTRTDAKGKLVAKTEYKYNSKGEQTKSISTSYYEGKKSTFTYTYKRTYWPGTKTLKKSVNKSSDGYVWETTFTKKGLLKKSVSSHKGSKETTTYTYKGKTLKSDVTKTEKGKVVGRTEYDSHGSMKSYTYYDIDGNADKTTYTNTYKKGMMVKQVEKNEYGTRTTTYNSKGDMVKAVSTSNYGGETETWTYKNTYKGGYLVEQKRYINGTYDGKTVYTYTSKKY